MWFAQYENKSDPHTSLRACAKAWGLSHTFGKRIEKGVYVIKSGNRDVYFVRQDKLQKYSRFLNQ